MKLEHFGMAEPGDCRLVFTAGAKELAAAIAQVQAGPDAPQEEDGLLTEAVNRTILGGFSALYEQLVQEYHVVPVTDPDFELLAVNRAEGFRAGAQFYALPPLEVGQYTGFVQAVEPHPIRQLTIELEINRHHGDEERAADAAGKAALRRQVARDIWAQRCAQAVQRARRELVWQLGDAVTGTLPKQLVGGNYFAEQRQFNLSLQANGINFDQFLKVRGQTVEEFRVWLHTQAAGWGCCWWRKRKASFPRTPRWKQPLPTGTRSWTASVPSRPTMHARCASVWPGRGQSSSSWSIPPSLRRRMNPSCRKLKANNNKKERCSTSLLFVIVIRDSQVSTPSNWLL